MKTRVIRSVDLNPSLVQSWRCLQESNSALANPYFCPEFTQAVSEVRQDVEIAVMEEKEKTLGFLPYQRSDYKIAEPVGGIFSDYQGLICDPTFEFDPIALIRSCGLVAWNFDHLI